jgi:hypothetical protein
MATGLSVKMKSGMIEKLDLANLANFRQSWPYLQFSPLVLFQFEFNRQVKLYRDNMATLLARLPA